MRNFFYAPFVVLMLLLGSCADSGEIDDEIGDVTTGVASVYVDQPYTLAFDTNLEKWDSKSIYISVDPGDYKIHRGSFSLATSDYFTTTVQATDVENQYEVLFRSTQEAEDLIDSLVIPMTIIMTYNGFEQVESEAFDVILPADRYYPYFVDQPTDTYFKAGFSVGDSCQTTFSVVAMDAEISPEAFSIEDSPYYDVQFFETDSLDEYIMRLYATQDFVDYTADVMNQYFGGDPYAVEYSDNWIWGDSVTVTMATIFDVEVPDMPILTTNTIHVKTELQNFAPEFVSIPDSVSFDINFESDETQILTFSVTPGTKDINYSNFELVSDGDQYFTVSSIRESAITDQFEIRLNPTDAAIGGLSDPAFSIDAQIKMSYVEYEETWYEMSEDIVIFFDEDRLELPTFTTLPTETLFPRGSVAGSSLTSTIYIDPGTMPVTTGLIWCEESEYYTTTFAETDVKNTWEVTFTLTDLAQSQALGSETANFDAKFYWWYEDDEGIVYDLVESEPFYVSLEGRVGFDYYFNYLTEQSVVFSMEAFDSSVITDDEILDKGVLYTTDSSLDVASWTKISAPNDGKTYAYLCALSGLTSSTTYYAMPFVEQADDLMSYGEVASFTTLGSASEVPAVGSWKWSWYLGTSPSDTDILAQFDSALEKAMYYLNAFCKGPQSNLSTMTIWHNTSITDSYYANNMLNISSDEINAETIAHLAVMNWGIGNSNSYWTSSSINANGYYVGSNGAAIYKKIMNDTSAALPTSNTTGMLDFGLIEELSNGGAPDEDFILFGLIINEMIKDGINGAFSAPSTFVPVSGINVALGKTVTTSATGNYGFGSYLVDGNTFSNYSRWTCSSSQTLPVTIEIDLDGTYEVIGTNYYGGYSGFNMGLNGYMVQYQGPSTSGQWVNQVIKVGQSEAIGYVADLFDTPVMATKIRFYISSTGSSSIALYEIEVMTDYVK